MQGAEKIRNFLRYAAVGVKCGFLEVPAREMPS
jgi:hypothetical protein